MSTSSRTAAAEGVERQLLVRRQLDHVKTRSIPRPGRRKHDRDADEQPVDPELTLEQDRARQDPLRSSRIDSTISNVDAAGRRTPRSPSEQRDDLGAAVGRALLERLDRSGGSSSVIGAPATVE